MKKNSSGKLPWFKHFNDASQGHTLSVLWANGDTEAIALFWLLLELISRFEDLTERGKIRISWSVLQRETNWKPTKCRRVLARIVPVSKIEMNEEPDGYVSFLVPNWLDFQEKRGGKRKGKKETKPGEILRYKEGEREDDERNVFENQKLNPYSPPPPKKNSVEKFDERFRFAAEYSEIENVLSKLFPSRILPTQIKRKVPEILKSCNGDMDRVREVATDLYQNPKVNGEEVLEGSRAAYIGKAIESAFGVTDA